ncbi:BolA family protein [Allochromatium vinosum]|uniref:BolA family protein n=1 Tax=Allochromatium vinosum (strain ATCC 17899 / DSM 180 / NBRC 103801 / NCIMB 10441 / D) TaxID=572477 RepID=D3RNU0_ALLVD|nr:BolA/IbaG family iron-sulfur metabolism protein [Allochromatium vinosum]ADC61450.1 BolA family protein [Allochromatium vinosum DSM 180]MBK1654320.1 BolA family protein [Allochromatium vinosum]
METEAVAQRIRAGLPGAEVQVTGDGEHFEAVVVSDAFEGLSLIKRERLVMETVREQVASGELHALSIKARTPAQQAAQG